VGNKDSPVLDLPFKGLWLGARCPSVSTHLFFASEPKELLLDANNQEKTTASK
jgi:hypothetical protein